MHYLNKTLNTCERIKQCMKEKGIKQAYLARELGLSPQHLNKILKNQESSKYMSEIAVILDLDVPVIKTLSERVKETIKEKGIKQVHLARELGLSPQHVNKILTRDHSNNQYLLQIAKILGLDDSSFDANKIANIHILTEKNLSALANDFILFDEISSVVSKCWPSSIEENYYHFGYELTQTISSKLFTGDLLIFSSCLPLDITGYLGIVFIQKTASIVVGLLKCNKKTIIIYNEHACIEFERGDLLFGVGVHLERKIGKDGLTGI